VLGQAEHRSFRDGHGAQLPGPAVDIAEDAAVESLRAGQVIPAGQPPPFQVGQPRRGQRRHSPGHARQPGAELAERQDLRRCHHSSVHQCVRAIDDGPCPVPCQNSLIVADQALYNTARPHQGIAQRVPDDERATHPATVTNVDARQIRRKPVLNGPINEYARAA
jgi:hypothetical protein